MKTIGIRLDEQEAAFLKKLSRETQQGLSATVRKLVSRGRIILAIDKYRNGKTSLGKSAGIAGLSVGEMMATLEEYRVKSNLETENYLEGLENLRKGR